MNPACLTFSAGLFDFDGEHMTRKDQMLDEFDDLAAAELDDIAAIESGRSTRSVSIRPAVQLRPARAPSSGWDWLIGIGVLSLVVLAARGHATRTSA